MTFITRGSRFNETAQRKRLGFRRNYSRMGAFTVSNQPMLPRSHILSTYFTFGQSSRSPLMKEMLWYIFLRLCSRE